MAGGAGAGEAITVVAFFFLCWAYGFGLLAIVGAKERKSLAHALLAQLGIGLAVLSFLAVVLRLLHVPIQIGVYLGIALAGLAAAALVRRREWWPKGRQGAAEGDAGRRAPLARESVWCLVILALVLGAFLALFLRGAFAYPYLEDDDPWNHAQGATYVAREHTYAVDESVRAVEGGYAFYLEPYPPTYDALMGVLRQANDSIVWTLKFFNALLAALAIAFIFLFAREYLGSDLKALFCAFVLAVLPSFMSHFIWSQTLALALFPVGLYALLKALSDDAWRIPAIVAIASMLVTQPVVSFVFGVVVLLLLATLLAHELASSGKDKGFLSRVPRTARGVVVGTCGVALSMAFWGAQLAGLGAGGIVGAKGSEFTSGWAGGYALQRYGLSEILFPPLEGRIDQATGIGLVLALLALAGICIIVALRKRTLSPAREWRHAHMLLWLLPLAYLVFAPTLGLPGWGSSRAWAYMAIPLALVATEATFIIAQSAAKGRQGLRIGIVAAIALCIAATCVPAKVAVQTSGWPPGGQWTAQEEVEGYEQMRALLPAGTRVLPLCAGDQRAIGFDMQSDPWDIDVARFHKSAINASGDEIVSFLEAHHYEYITLDATCVRDYGENATIALSDRISETGKFSPAIQSAGFLLAEVR